MLPFRDVIDIRHLERVILSADNVKTPIIHLGKAVHPLSVESSFLQFFVAAGEYGHQRRVCTDMAR